MKGYASFVSREALLVESREIRFTKYEIRATRSEEKT